MSFTNSNTTENQKEWLANQHAGHLVQFYDYESQLISPLSDYICEGLIAGETCIVIASDRHLAKLKQQLIKNNVRLSKDQLITPDASDTLNSFMINGSPDWEAFLDNVGGIVEKAAQKARPIRAFGEMVALLWQAGNTGAVMELEQFWNELAKMYDFKLYCAYPMVQFDLSLHNSEARQICNLHTHSNSLFGKKLQVNAI